MRCGRYNTHESATMQHGILKKTKFFFYKQKCPKIIIKEYKANI